MPTDLGDQGTRTLSAVKELRYVSLVVLEDDADFVEALPLVFSPELEIRHARSLAQAKEAVDDRCLAVLVDLFLEGDGTGEPTGMQFLKWMSAERPSVPVIVVTGFGRPELEEEAMRLGADDFFDKGRDTRELDIRVRNAVKRRAAIADDRSRLAEYEPGCLIGDSHVMRRVRQAVEGFAAQLQSSVLLTGELGTGKGLAARLIHRSGNWRHLPFIHWDMRSSLLGIAPSGTLYLPELTELPLEDQKLLLATLRNSQQLPDLHIIAATVHDLDEAEQSGRLLAELRAELGVVELRMPPLRDHLADISALAECFLALPSAFHCSVSQSALHDLMQYEWPGNVRELRSVLDVASLRAWGSDQQVVLPEHLPSYIAQRDVSATGRMTDLNVQMALARAELNCVTRALRRTHGAKEKAAALLGYSGRHAMRRRIESIRSKHPNVWNEFPDMERYYLGGKRSD